jgi:ABC-type sugar transport system permease subunit/ABC-type glycerol-3-phosphate transport system substrate-binding protein
MIGKFLRRNTRLLTPLLVLACLTLCGQAMAGWIEDAPGKTIIHLNVYSLPDPNNPDTFTRAEVAGVKLFKKRFPDFFAERYRDKYKALPEKYGQHNWDNVEIQLHKSTGIVVEGVEVDLLQIAGDLAPDILYVNFRKSDNYIQAGFLYPLDKPEDGYLGDLSKAKIDGDGISRSASDIDLLGMTDEELNFRINPKIWPVIRRKGPYGKTQTWAVPFGGALGKVLAYRKDLFDEYGVAHPTVDWTWDDLMDAAKKITNPEKGHYGIQLGRGKQESWFWITFLWSAGGEVMVYNPEEDSWRCTFDTQEAAMALDFYTHLSAEKWIDAKGKVRRGYSSKDASESSAKWTRGEIGMQFIYVDEKLLATINPEVVGMVPVPLGPTGKRGAELNSRMMGLFSRIEDPVVRDAAWEYIRFYDAREAVALKTQIMVEGGLGRFINPKYLRMFGYSEIERLSPKGWAEYFDIAIATGKPEPYGKNSNVAYEMMTFPIQEAEQLMLNDQLPDTELGRLQVMRELLVKHNSRANMEMIGLITPEERSERRMVAVVVLLGIIIAFTFVFRKISRIFTAPGAGDGDQPTWAFRKYLPAYLMLIPAALSILVWSYVPVLRGSAMAFFDYQILRESTWVGVDNFGDLIYDKAWWHSVWNALRYSFLVIAMTFIPPIVLAIFLQEVPRGKLVFRTIYYLPAVITGLVTVLMWKQFYEPSENGALNALMLHIPAIGFVVAGLALMGVALAFARRLHLNEMYGGAIGFVVAGVLLFVGFSSLANPIFFPGSEAMVDSLARIPWRLFSFMPEPNKWLTNPETAMISCVIPMVWAGMGPGCLIYLAALKGIPDDYYEAADIDGASFIDKILFVVFPMLKALILINFVGAFIGSWYAATGNILLMTGGGGNTEVAGLHIWYKAFTYLKFGPATAMAWMLGFMLIGFTVHQLQILSRVEFRAATKKD